MTFSPLPTYFFSNRRTVSASPLRSFRPILALLLALLLVVLLLSPTQTIFSPHPTVFIVLQFSRYYPRPFIVWMGNFAPLADSTDYETSTSSAHKS